MSVENYIHNMTTLKDPHQIEIVVDTEHSHYHGPAWYGWSTEDNCHIAIYPAFNENRRESPSFSYGDMLLN